MISAKYTLMKNYYTLIKVITCGLIFIHFDTNAPIMEVIYDEYVGLKVYFVLSILWHIIPYINNANKILKNKRHVCKLTKNISFNNIKKKSCWKIAASKIRGKNDTKQAKPKHVSESNILIFQH